MRPTVRGRKRLDVIVAGAKYYATRMSNMRMRPLFACLLSLALLLGEVWDSPARAEVRLPKVFGNHMVLQQEKPIVIWGWAQPREAITVQLGAETRQAQANELGEWKVVLPALKAGGPLTLSITGSNMV